MSIGRLPMIFLLRYSKALDHTKKWRWLRLLFTFAFVLLMLASIFMLVILIPYDREITLPLPASIVSLVFLLSLFLSSYAFDAVIMLRKDLDAARLALNNWNKVKEKGKLLFIFNSHTIEILHVIVWLYVLGAKRLLGPGPKVSTLIIRGVFILGILLAIRFIIWQLNIRNEDKVEAQIRQELLA